MYLQVKGQGKKWGAGQRAKSVTKKRVSLIFMESEVYVFSAVLPQAMGLKPHALSLTSVALDS